MQRIRARLKFANVVSLLALFVALGGSSYAAVTLQQNSVGAKQIKSGAVGSSEVKNGSLLKKDFKKGQLPAGAKGAQGIQGIQGLQGVQGPTGFVGSVIVHRTDVALPGGTPGATTSAFATCAAGEKLIGGSVNVSSSTTGEVLISRPAGDDVGSGAVPEDGEGFTFWKGTARATTAAATVARVFAICAKTS